jgi:hypothetical protein
LHHFFASQRVTFFCLLKKKQLKKRLLPATAFGFPVLIQKIGRSGTRANKPHKPWFVAELRQVLAKIPQLFKSSQARQQGI